MSNGNVLNVDLRLYKYRVLILNELEAIVTVIKSNLWVVFYICNGLKR